MIDTERLKDEVSVFDLLNEIGATCRSDRKVFCPFCHDAYSRNPGASVTADGSWYTCWVCGVKGDVIELAKLHLGVDFKEACEWLEGLIVQAR